MSDDRIAETPLADNPCPHCRGAIANAPAGPCLHCGPRLPTPAPMPDVRLSIERFRFGDPASIMVGAILTFYCVAISLATRTFGLLIPLAILFVPAMIRTVRLRIARSEADFLQSLELFFASLSFSFVLSLAAGVACGGVCLATSVLNFDLDTSFILGGIVGVTVFLVLFILFWPRQRSAPPRRASDED